MSLMASIDWATLVEIIAAISVLYYILTAIYSWNRLRAFPAASWSAHFSYLWLAKTTYSGRQYWVHRSLHKDSRGTSEPFVRVGPNELVTNNPDVVKIISGTDERWRRDPFYITGRFNPYHDNLFSRLDPGEHRLAKSRTIAAYSGRETPDLEVGVDDVVKTLLSTMQGRYTTAVNSPSEDSCLVPPSLDLGKTSCYFTLDVITRLAFGQETGFLRADKDHYNFLGSLHELWPRMSTCADIPWIRKVLFSSFCLGLVGPKPTDKSGFGALMG